MRRKFENLCQSIQGVLLVFLAYAFFCVLALSQPDEMTLKAAGKIKMPFADVEASFLVFWIVGPAILCLILLYLHILLEQWHAARYDSFRYGTYSTYMFCIDSDLARGVSIFTFYLLGPGLLAWFVVKLRAWPRSWLEGFGVASIIVTLLLMRLLRRRYPGRRPQRWTTALAGVLTALLGLISLPHFSADLLPLHLADSDLSGLSLSSYYLKGASFSGATLKGADFSEEPGDHLERADFSFSKLEGTDFTSAHLEGARFDHTTGTADFSQAHLENADFNHAHLEDADFDEAHLTGVKFNHAKLRRAKLGGQNMSGVDFNVVDLEGAELDRAHLEGATFTHSKLSYANLSDAHFDGATFDRTCLGGTDVEGAVFKGATFKRSYLVGLRHRGEEQFKEASGADTNADNPVSACR